MPTPENTFDDSMFDDIKPGIRAHPHLKHEPAFDEKDLDISNLQIIGFEEDKGVKKKGTAVNKASKIKPTQDIVTKLGKRQQEWIDELRKTKVEQIKGFMATTKGCDPLGILCRLHPTKAPEKVNADGISVFDNNMYFVPFKVQQHLAMRTASGGKYPVDFKKVDKLSSVAMMNDHDMTFSEIADILENNPNDYFKKSV
jgi:hypothetical protein